MKVTDYFLWTGAAYQECLAAVVDMLDILCAISTSLRGGGVCFVSIRADIYKHHS